MHLNKHYVYAPIRGQLGNQMFIYAMLRSLSIDTKCLPGFSYGEGWPYALNCFKISNEFNSLVQLPKSNVQKFSERVFRYFFRLCKTPRNQYNLSKYCNWFLGLTGIFICPMGYVKPFIPFLKRKNTYCDGYFQSEKYFKKHKDLIKKEFTFVDEIKKNCSSLALEISSVNAVCVHIRLGDYLGLPDYCVTDKSYFQRAMRFIMDNVENPVFYVFSDEPYKALELLEDNNIKFIPLSYSGSESMYLGSLCRHHILSNSSFSWWMQYLGAKDGQIVIAPSRWYNDDKIIDGLYQEHWIIM